MQELKRKKHSKMVTPPLGIPIAEMHTAMRETLPFSCPLISLYSRPLGCLRPRFRDFRPSNRVLGPFAQFGGDFLPSPPTLKNHNFDQNRLYFP